MLNIFNMRVYYEDTDFSGAVYHANYFKFIERARSDLIFLLGINQLELQNKNMFFIVTSISAKFIRPAFFGDSLKVETAFVRVGGAKIQIDQKIFKKDRCLFEADVNLALISDGSPKRIPKEIKKLLN